jgi:hypothetical protein
MSITMPTVVDATLPDGSDGTLLNLALWTALGAAIDAADAVKAPLASPALTGVPTAPTAAAATTTTQLATTAFVAAESALKAALPGTSAPTTTGTQTALPIPAGTGDLVLYLNNATLLTIQGIAAGLSGQRLTVISKGAGQVDLAHLHASGTALGKLKLCATTGLTSLAAGSGVAVVQYDATVTQWRLVAHEQGAWITPTYAAGTFTGNASMTWTVDAGDVGTLKYRLAGRTMTVAYSFTTTSVGGTPAGFLQIGNAAYGGFTMATGDFEVPTAIALDNAAAVDAYSQGSTSGVAILLRKANGAAWTASTNNTALLGVAIFEVQ